MSSRLLVLIGLPGSGKSTYAAAHHWPTLSSDDIRVLLTDDIANQQANAQVFATLRFLLRQRLRLHRPITCLDATNLLRKHRAPFIKIGRDLGARVEAVHFDIALDTCLARNAARPRQVPEAVIRQMHHALQPPSLTEFDQIHTVTL